MVLAVAVVGLTVAMLRAERRARRRLYRALGLGDGVVELLMARNSDVLTELNLLRKPPMASAAAKTPGAAVPAADEPIAEPEASPEKAHPTAHPIRSADVRPPPGQRRQPYSGRHRRL
ncbi:MAG TPA: hypothetical protein VIE16_07615 [Phenylobacterium sp.]